MRVIVLWFGLTVALVSCASDDHSVSPEDLRTRSTPVSRVRSGRYEMVGTRRDSRKPDKTSALRGSYAFGPIATVGGEPRRSVRHTGFLTSDGRYELAYRADGSYRLSETSGFSSWTWKPAFFVGPYSLRVGREWSAHSTAETSSSGSCRTTKVSMRVRVTGVDSVALNGRNIAVLVIEGRTTTEVFDTRVDTGEETTLVVERTDRTWLSPAHGLPLRSHAIETARRDLDGRGDYVLVDDLRLQAIDPS